MLNDGRIVNIPWDKLSPETLMAIIKEYVTRDGTDYGEVDVPLEQKIMQVQNEIISGKALVLFDTKDQSCNIFSSEDPAIKGLPPF